MVTQHILVCGGTACTSTSGKEIFEQFLELTKKHGLGESVQIVQTGCFGLCERGPIVKIFPDNTFYVNVEPEDVEEIVTEQLIKGRVVKHLLYDPEKAKKAEQLDFYKKQMRIVLRNCGVIDPENIEEYIARDGYLALEKALFQLSPQQIIDEVKKSGLRGRGGAGFPTGLKWEAGMNAQSKVKYVVCNADEGDPGAYMDRSTIEGDPHSILEAMTICGKAIGSHQGFIYIRAEYPLAVERLYRAMDQARERGLLGKDILGSGFDFDIEIRLGAGAFVCGEETALLRSIEGLRGMPTPKPPFPAQCGLWGEPTIINNVETWANVPVILTKGADWFASIGTEDSKGTKVFAITGKVKNSGLVEVPMGTTLREIIFDIGGGIKGGKQFKGVQTGGPSGGILTDEHLDTPIDFGALTRAGSMMGSGGMIVMDEDDCVVDVAKFYMDFCVDESCGKCSPCRIGTRQMLMLLEKISDGKGELKDLQTLEDIGFAMQKASLCALGQTAPNPTLSTLRRFRSEYLAHIGDPAGGVPPKCPTGKCKNLTTYRITDACKGCTLCQTKCPTGAISGEPRAQHLIDPSKCIRCGVCFETCKFSAVVKE
ncbi:MAG: NADH-quinone oxidoreductase subunit NuoF [Spirochaetaceae bacterium]|jgi:NADH-quinone oxidoreductase subunit F/NADP-reducing hydrogenase subunit HndC|nr:NADH-quinone oxidoreductase subunit NuoF [Spirochaetaceae bacterium]